MILSRRSLLGGLIAAPMIVRPGIIMPIKHLTLDEFARVYVEAAIRELERQLKADIRRDMADIWHTPTSPSWPDLLLGWKTA